jgi:hypothetical protein
MPSAPQPRTRRRASASRRCGWRGASAPGLGQDRLAAEAYLALLAIRPADPEARLLLGRALVEHGWPDLAGAALAPLAGNLPGWWRQVAGWAREGVATARREARTLLARRQAGRPDTLPALVRRLIRCGRIAAAGCALRRMPDGAEAAFLAACLAERRAWPDALPAEPPGIAVVDAGALDATLRIEAACWFMRRGEAARAAALLRGVPEAGLGDAGWLLRARLLVLDGQAARLEGLAAAQLGIPGQGMRMARLRLTGLLLGGGLAPLHAEALPAGAAPDRDLPLVQYWDSPDPPPDVAAVMASWAEHHPRRRLLRFHRRTARDWIAEHHGAEAAAAFDACPHPAVEADLLRYAVLAREGGLWADADDVCRLPWDGVLAAVPPAGLIATYSDELPCYVFNAPLVARPGNPILARALRKAIRGLLTQRPGERLRVWRVTGPGLLTRLVAAEPDGCRLLGRALARHLARGADGLAYKLVRAADWRPD